MGHVNYTVEIKAPPEKVFDFIARVEEFKKYSSLITDIEKLPDGTYRWRVNMLGMPFEWDSVITESFRPKRFAWRSIRGPYNEGGYTLKPEPGGTLVEFEMRWRTGEGLLLDTLTYPIQSYMITKVYKEFLENVKRALEVKGETDLPRLR